MPFFGILGPGKLGPGKSGPGRLGPLAANWAPEILLVANGMVALEGLKARTGGVLDHMQPATGAWFKQGGNRCNML